MTIREATSYSSKKPQSANFVIQNLSNVPIWVSKKEELQLLLFHSLFLFSFHISKRIFDNKGNTKLDIIIKIISIKFFPIGHHPLSIGDNFIIG